MSFKDYLKEWGGSNKTYGGKTNGEISEIADKAQMAFWAVVAKELPEIKTGDFSPGAVHEFDTACEDAIRYWIVGNQNAEEHDAYWDNEIKKGKIQRD